MDYLSEKLLELIKNKVDLTGVNTIKLSLSEIADTWNRNVIHRYTRPDTTTSVPSVTTVEQIYNSNFIGDINMALKKLADEKLIGEYTPLNEFRFYASLHPINLVVLKGFNKHQKEKSEKLFDYKECCFWHQGKTYKPNEPERIELIRMLWLKKRKEDKKGKPIREGERLAKNYLAVKIGMIQSLKEFENKIIKRRFKEMRKGLNRIFRDKKFPLRIASDPEGILLIVIE